MEYPKGPISAQDFFSMWGRDTRRRPGAQQSSPVAPGLQKLWAVVSSVGLFHLLPLWEMNPFEKWVKATDQLSKTM